MEGVHAGLLSESPVWDAAAALLRWVDIRSCSLHHVDLSSGRVGTRPLAEQVGFALPDDAGGLVLGLRSGLHRLVGDDVTPFLPSTWDPATHRANDGKTDRAGRLWVGTLEDGESEPTAAFFRLEHDRPDVGVREREAASGAVPRDWKRGREATPGPWLRRVIDGVVVANGPAFDQAGSTMYWADSPTGTIRAAALDPDSALPQRSRVHTHDEDCFPDGMTVDVDDFLWSAKWGGGRIVRSTPSGTVDRVLTLPVSRVTSVCFVGSRRDVLAVTTAADPQGREELAGRVLILDVGVAGPLEAPVSLGVSG